MAVDLEKYRKQPASTSTPAVDISKYKKQTVPVAPVEPVKKDGFFKSLAKDVAGTLVVNPVTRTTEALGRLGVFGGNIKKGYEEIEQKGTGQNVLGINVPRQKAFGDGGAKQILGGGLKTLSYLYGGGALPSVGRATLAGKIGTGLLQGVKVGAVGGGSYSAGEELQKDTSTLVSTAKQGALGAAIGGLTGGALGGLAPVIPAIAQSMKPSAIMQRVARVSAGDQRKFASTANESIGEYLTKRGIYGTDDEIVTQLAERFVKSKNLADDELAKLGGVWKSEPVDVALKQLAEREARVSVSGALSKDYNRVQELVAKNAQGGLTMPEINEVKRLFERNVKTGYLKEMNSDKIALATNIDSRLREWQFNQAKKLGLENLDEINKETRLAKQLGDSLYKKQQGAGGNNAFGLTDAILLSGGDPQAIAMLGSKKFFGSGAIQSKIAKTLAGKPTIGQPSAKTRAPMTGVGNLLPSATKAETPIYVGGKEIPDISGTNVAGQKAMADYYENLRQQNTLRLPASEAIPMGTQKVPDISGTNFEGQKAMADYYENLRRENTLRLPAGNPNLREGAPIPLFPPKSIEPQSPKIGIGYSGLNQAISPTMTTNKIINGIPENITPKLPKKQVGTAKVADFFEPAPKKSLGSLFKDQGGYVKNPLGKGESDLQRLARVRESSAKINRLKPEGKRVLGEFVNYSKGKQEVVRNDVNGLKEETYLIAKEIGLDWDNDKDLGNKLIELANARNLDLGTAEAKMLKVKSAQ